MKIMILSTKHTGLGHNSIAESMQDALQASGFECKIFDMVDMCRPLVERNCKAYGKVTNKTPFVWGAAYGMSHLFGKFIKATHRHSIKQNFKKAFFAYCPDCILTVHALFVGSVLDIVRPLSPQIPFVTLVADLVNINPLWFDTRATMTICPTHECVLQGRNHSLDKEKLAFIKFVSRTQIISKAKTLSLGKDGLLPLPQSNAPTPPSHNPQIKKRSSFVVDRVSNDFMLWGHNTATSSTPTKQSNHAILDSPCPASEQITLSDNNTHPPQTIRCLLMSGGEGADKIVTQVSHILKLPYTQIQLVCGKNKQLKNKCDKLFATNPRVTVSGFVTQMAEALASTDIALVRGSPNVLMECVNLLIPVIVTYCLPGQEKDNGKYITQNNLGVLCTKAQLLPQAIQNLCLNQRARLQQIKKSQFAYRDLQASNRIAALVYNLCLARPSAL